VNIPRIIHQTLPDKVNLAPGVADNVARLKGMNPDWHHVLYDDQDIQSFVRDHYDAGVLDTLNSINPLYGAARADLFRYLLMFKLGGVYLDIKSSCNAPFDTLIRPDDVMLLARWNNQPGEKFHGWGAHVDDGVNSELQNWHVICAPGHPLIQAVIDAVLGHIRGYTMRRYGVGKFGVLRTTGPIAYTKAIAPLLHELPHRIFDSDASGLVYSAVQVPGRNSGHMGLFTQHYTRVKVPLVSSGKQTILHYAHYKVLRIFGLIA
jgi:inositol phosphorylceramide mannosyltransferase catalytic subunit